MPQVWELAQVGFTTVEETGERIPHLHQIEDLLKTGWEPFAITADGYWFRHQQHLSPELDMMTFAGLESGVGWMFYVGPKVEVSGVEATA